MSNNVGFQDLLGEHFLTGIDMGTMRRNEYDYEAANTIDFIIDGKIYSAIEDPDDGYRSSMESFSVNRDGVTIKNTFAQIKVIGRMADNSEYETNDILEFIDAQNGKIILRVGTGNTNDYYPYFVGEWMPENLSINEGKS